MKIKGFFAMMLTASLFACGLSSCDDDDDDDEDIAAEVASNNDDEEDIAAEVASNKYGTYSLANATYFKDMFTDEEDGGIVLTRINTELVKVEFTSKRWGEFTIDSATVSKENNVYTVKGSGSVSMASHGGEAKQYDATLEANVDGDKTVFTFTAPTVMGGTTIKVYNVAPDDALVVASASPYKGTLNCSVASTTYDPVEDARVVVAKTDDGKISITLPEFAVSEKMKQPIIIVEDVEIASSDNGIYTFSVDSYEKTIEEMVYRVTDLKGEVNDGKLSLTYNVTPGAMPMAINYSFESTK